MTSRKDRVTEYLTELQAFDYKAAVAEVQSTGEFDLLLIRKLLFKAMLIADSRSCPKAAMFGALFENFADSDAIPYIILEQVVDALDCISDFIAIDPKTLLRSSNTNLMYM